MSDSITFNNNSDPVLAVDNLEYQGINILSKLKHLKDYNAHDQTINKFYKKASLYFQNDSIPVVKYILQDKDAVAPTKNIEDVGYDLTIIKEYQKISNNTSIYDTCVSFQLPLGWFGSVHLRSSASKTGYIMSNCTGIIDPGYTGTVKVALTKIDHELPNLKLPLRIAQIIICPYVNTDLNQTYENIQTNRGVGGFGSTN